VSLAPVTVAEKLALPFMLMEDVEGVTDIPTLPEVELTVDPPPPHATSPQTKVAMRKTITRLRNRYSELCFMTYPDWKQHTCQLLLRRE
jgi:hypothetical protein